MTQDPTTPSTADFKLQHPGTCTGMHWRSAPAGLTHRLAGAQPDWPRNGAVLRGIVHELAKAEEGNTQWLEVIEYSPTGEMDAFIPAPGCWMPFTQGGLLLHPVE